jgi:hypothetical protein
MKATGPAYRHWLRGVVAVGCAAVFSLVLAAAWGGLTEVTLPHLESMARSRPEYWFSYGFWSLVRFSLPFWLAALWITAIGTFFDYGAFFRLVRGAFWLAPAVICLGGFVIGTDLGGWGSALVVPPVAEAHLVSADVFSP